MCGGGFQCGALAAWKSKELTGNIIIVKKIKIFVFFFSILLLIYSCGQKGPLIMPEKKYPSSNEDSEVNNK